MSEDDFDAKRKEFGDEFVAKMGPKASREIVAAIDLDIEIESCATDRPAPELKIKKNAKRLRC
jgi:DNA-directed RNA polymerase subunit beta'